MTTDKNFKSFARDVYDKSEISINTVAEKQDCSIYTRRISKLWIFERLFSNDELGETLTSVKMEGKYSAFQKEWSDFR